MGKNGEPSGKCSWGDEQWLIIDFECASTVASLIPPPPPPSFYTNQTNQPMFEVFNLDPPPPPSRRTAPSHVTVQSYLLNKLGNERGKGGEEMGGGDTALFILLSLSLVAAMIQRALTP